MTISGKETLLPILKREITDLFLNISNIKITNYLLFLRVYEFSKNKKNGIFIK